MCLRSLDHCSIRTTKLKETRDFYVDVLGLVDGERPDFPFPGHWLYLDGHAAVHLIGVDADDPAGLEDYLGGSIDAAELQGSGAFDHIAFRAAEAPALIERLEARGLPYFERQVPNMDLFQIFLEDPNGITVELNYAGADRKGRGGTGRAAGGAGMGRDTAAPIEEMMRRARELVPALKERAAETERLRRLPDRTFEDLHASGLWRIVQPGRWGGSELNYRAQVEVPMELARGCASTAWVHTNLALHHYMLGMWPAAAQDEVWGGDPDTLIASALIYHAGTVDRVAGGFRVSGRWPFCSGIEHCDWVMLGGMAPPAAGGGPPAPHIFVVPRANIEVIDTWQVAGLAGTGSHDVACADVQVPAHMVVAAAELRGGPSPGSAVNPGPLYRLPLLALFPHVLAGPMVGTAMGAHEDQVEELRGAVSLYNRSSVAEHTTMQLRVAEAGVLIDGARLLMRDNCDEAHRIAEAAEVPGLETKTRWRRDAAYAAANAVKALDLIQGGAGGRANYASHPLQRRSRDIRAAAAQIQVLWDINAPEYGRAVLGLKLANPNL